MGKRTANEKDPKWRRQRYDFDKNKQFKIELLNKKSCFNVYFQDFSGNGKNKLAIYIDFVACLSSDDNRLLLKKLISSSRYLEK